MTNEEATEALAGKTEQEIRDKWGEPQSLLSGLWGDIYVYDENEIVIYYDTNGTVSDVRIWKTEQ